MWIDASECKPDTARKVFVKGTRRPDETALAVACWWDFDTRWASFMIIDNEDTAIGIQVTHWMEIKDILTLGVPESEEDTKTGVHEIITFNITTEIMESGLSKGMTFYSASFADGRESTTNCRSAASPLDAVIERCSLHKLFIYNKNKRRPGEPYET